MDARKFRLARRVRATKTLNCPSGCPTFRFVMRREMLRNFQTDLQARARLLSVGCRHSLAWQQGCETCARSRRARNARRNIHRLLLPKSGAWLEELGR